jgi:hypothetical protein
MHKFEFKQSILEELSATPEARLIQAILARALQDATTGFGRDRDDARRFLTEPNYVKDLCLIMTDYDEEFVVEFIQKFGSS